MKDLFGSVSKIIEAGPVKIDNPVAELAVVAVAAVGLLYAGYKVLNDKGAAENIATAFGQKADKES